MDGLLSWLKVHVLTWLTPPKAIQVIDIIQVILIAYFVYHLILWVKNTRAYTLLKGILFILAFVIVANLLGMEVIVWLIGNLGVAVFTAIIIIFQPELRKALEQVGDRSIFDRWFRLRSGDEDKRFSDQTVNEITRACFEMGEVRTGALIVIERSIKLDEYERTGISVDAIVSEQLLVNIFEHNTPLHDGAVIIRGDRIAAATCYLPLSDSLSLDKKLGTRHRAGLGISEASDCLTIIVSEETGYVSYAMGGVLRKAVSQAELKEQLHGIQTYGRARPMTKEADRHAS